jgi:hypothetical protein
MAITISGDLTVTGDIAINGLLNVSSSGIHFDDGSVQTTAANTPTYVTSLPGSPTDGQEVYYVADGANDIIWHLRYNSTSGYWEFLGGPALYAEVTTSESTTSTAYADLATVGPNLTVPLDGDYQVTVSAYMSGSSFQGNTTNYMSFAVGGTAATDADSAVQLTRSYDGGSDAQNVSGTPVRTSRKTSVSGGTTITAKYKLSPNFGSAHSASFERRWMEITPVRIAP